jgi:predicted metal-dependent hydrolase
VGHDGVVVVLPERAPERLAEELIHAKWAWLERALLRVEGQREKVLARPLRDGGVVPYLGRELSLAVEVVGAGERTSVSAQLARGRVRVRAAGDDSLSVAAPLERWYRRRARVEVGQRLDAVTVRNGTHYSRLTIRDQSTRWGSCSAAGAMSFNWRLLLAPAPVLDYVVEHEAAHLEVHDHSQRFWALLDARMPEWRTHRDWLREHGGSLRLV